MFKNKNKTLFSLLVFLSLLIILSGCDNISLNDEAENIEESVNIAGSLIDENENNPASALIVLKQGDKEITRKYVNANWNFDPTEIQGGSFTLENIKDGEYTLQIYKLGYETKTKNVLANDSDVDLGTISLTRKESISDGLNTVYFLVPNKAISPMDEVNLRKALTLAVDQESFSVPSELELASGVITPEVYGYRQRDILEYDKEKAQQIINDNNYENIEFSLRYYNDETGRINELMELLKSDWEALEGIEAVNLKPFSAEETPNRTDYGIYRSGWTLDNPDPLFLLTSLNDYHNFSDPINEIIDETKLKLDSESEALDLIYKAEQKIIERGEMIPLFFYNN